MTRIKKRRSGKKRTQDRKKVSAGRRGARAVKKEMIAKEKKAVDVKPKTGESANAQMPAAQKTTGKKRSAGARRIAAAKSVAGNRAMQPANKKATSVKKEGSEDKPAKKGFAPWNKNKFKNKTRED